MLKLKFGLIIVLLGWLSACVTVVEDQPKQPPSALEQELRRTSVISTSDPGFNPQPGARVAWRDGLQVLSSDGKQINPDLKEKIKSHIDRNLAGKGFRFSQPGQPIDYWVHGLILLGDELNEEKLGQILGFEPGLVSQSRNYEKGSLVLILVNPNNPATKWRGVVQVFTSTELTEAERELRLDYIIRSLMHPLPNLLIPKA